MNKKEAIREAYGLELVKMGEIFPQLVVLDADVSKSTRTLHFAKQYPDRFVNFGIAEQNMMAAAAGMASMGEIPIVNSFSFLTTYRAADQFRTSIVYPRLNVKVGASYGGLSDSFDGPTHQTVADIAWVRSLPNLTIVVPSDAQEMRSALPEIIRHQGPVWFRLCRAETEVLHSASYQFQLGRAEIIKDGDDITLMSCGIMLARTLQAAKQLEDQGYSVQVVNVPTIKPLDEDTICRCAGKTRTVVTVEEHNIIGGLGAAVCEVTARENLAKVVRVGIPDTFAESGPYDALLDRYGMSVKQITATALNLIKAGK